jgi:hypothetical protein
MNFMHVFLVNQATRNSGLISGYDERKPSIAQGSQGVERVGKVFDIP